MRWFILVLFFFVSGCAGNDKSLIETNRKQAATIDALNQELLRLNEELNKLIHQKDALSAAKKELEKKFENEMAQGDLSIAMDSRGLVVTVLDRILFDSGRAELKPESEEVLTKVADTLATQDHKIFVEGHTDNVPIRYSNWRSNWELSTARALEVLHFFTDIRGIAPEKLAASGYAEYQPVESNDTAEGRLKNRRVEIVISPQKA